MNAVEYNQENINILSNLILSDADLRNLAITENWGDLCMKLIEKYPVRSFYSQPGGFSFLYHFFLELDDFDILSMYRRIPPRPFYQDHLLTELSLPDNIQTIAESAFRECKNLKKIFLPDTITRISAYAFCICNSLETFKFPKSVEYVTDGVLFNCRNLKSITLPKTVQQIERDAFADCPAMNSIYYDGTVEEFQKIERKPFWHAGRSSKWTVYCSDGQLQV